MTEPVDPNSYEAFESWAAKPGSLEDDAFFEEEGPPEVESTNLTRYTKGSKWKQFMIFSDPSLDKYKVDVTTGWAMIERMEEQIKKAGSNSDDVHLITWVLSGEPTGQFRDLSADLRDRPALTHMDLIQESIEYARDWSGERVREVDMEKAIKAALTTKIIRKV